MWVGAGEARETWVGKSERERSPPNLGLRGVQVSSAEVDMFGRRNICVTQKRRHEVGEMLFWNWCWAHMRFVGLAFKKLPGYAELNARFRERIDFCWAPYSELVVNGIEYNPEERAHQTPRVGVIIDELFTRGFRKGVQNQAQHDDWVLERNIKPMLTRAEILTPS